MFASDKRYTSIAIILHWMMAICFLGMIGSGLIMVYLNIDPSFKFQLYQWHKSLGVLLLAALFIRLGWRLFHKPPALPDSFPVLERKAAKFGHWGLYLFMFLMPVSGWIMVSASIYGLPTIVFGWFEWPHIPWIESDEAIENQAKRAHFIFSIIFGLMIAAHIGAVIKHYIKDNENLMTRLWWVKNSNKENNRNETI